MNLCCFICNMIVAFKGDDVSFGITSCKCFIRRIHFNFGFVLKFTLRQNSAVIIIIWTEARI